MYMSAYMVCSSCTSAAPTMVAKLLISCASVRSFWSMPTVPMQGLRREAEDRGTSCGRPVLRSFSSATTVGGYVRELSNFAQSGMPARIGPHTNNPVVSTSTAIQYRERRSSTPFLGTQCYRSNISHVYFSSRCSHGPVA